jgi:hypothetical protein
VETEGLIRRSILLKEFERIFFLRCSRCGTEYTSITPVGKNSWKCYKCNLAWKYDEGKWRTKKVPAKRCPICERLVPIIRENISAIGLVCPTCSRVWYTTRWLEKEVILIPTRNEIGRSRPLGNFRIVETKTWRDYGALSALIDEAREEDSSFRFTPYSERNSFTTWLVLVKQDFGGYVSWNLYKDRPCLRQIFVRKRFRGGGIASALVSRLNTNGDLIVESPNDATLAILVRLGYATKQEDGIHGTRVSFLPAQL